MVHEMLGHVEYFMRIEDQDDLIPCSDDDCKGEGDSRSWNVVTAADSERSSGKEKLGQVHADRAAMHYQSALDILDCNQLDWSDSSRTLKL